jgi:RNA-directed DNA polymerase
MHNEEVSAATAEGVAGRERAAGKAVEHTRVRTPCRRALPRALDRRRAAARQDRTRRLTARWHQVYDIDRRREAYPGLNREAPPGVDGQTWAASGDTLEAHRRDMSDRRTRGTYHASPVERVDIPKPDGRQRPLGIPTLDEKMVQRATGEVLNALDAGDFLGVSDGFRPGRRPHDALAAVTVGLETHASNGGLEADIRGVLEAIDPGGLVQFVKHRMGDRRVVRHLLQGLNAGGLEGGTWRVRKRSILRLRPMPRPGASERPSRRWARNRLAQWRTTVRCTPTACATADGEDPATSRRIIFPRRASPTAMAVARCHPASV